MQTVTNSGVSRETSIFIIVPLALCQLYCITLYICRLSCSKRRPWKRDELAEHAV